MTFKLLPRLSVVILFVLLACAQGPEGKFVLKWGSEGTGDGKFESPQGIAVDKEGNVYVADTGNHRVQKFTAAGKFITKWGTLGNAPGEFNEPWGIALDRAGIVYVADTKNSRVQKFTRDGSFLEELPLEAEGYTTSPFPPVKIAINMTGNLYIMTSLAVHVFDPKGTELRGLMSHADWHQGDGPYVDPQDIAIDDNGNVYVAVLLRGVQKFGTDGTYLEEWCSGRKPPLRCPRVPFGTPEPRDGSSVISSGDLSLTPLSVAIDKARNVYVTAAGDLSPMFYPRTREVPKFAPDAGVVVFNPLGTVVAKWGSGGSADGQFYFPSGIAIDGTGNAFVLDSGLNRVQKFRLGDTLGR